METKNNVLENGGKSETLVTVKNLKKSFGKQHVLKGVSIELHRGENLVVLGKSGTGKSVLIKCIVGLMQPDDGDIIVLNNNLRELDDENLSRLRQKIGFLFQGGALYDSMTVKENLEFPLRRIRKELSEKKMQEKIMQALESVGLPDVVNKMPSELSGGMRKRISLARTIVVDPEIMLYDEPTTGLDPATSDEISKLILEIQDKYNTSSIIITHDIRCARLTADRVVMLNEGSVYKTGLLSDFRNSTDALIQAFFNGTE